MINLSNNDKVLLHLSMIPGVGPGTVINKILRGFLMHRHPDRLLTDLADMIDVQTLFSLNDLYAFSSSDFVRVCGLTEKNATNVVRGLADQALLCAELDRIDRHGVVVRTLLDAEYPEILKQIHLPPIVLYCKGAPLLTMAKRFSIVGARKADAYADKVIQSIVPELVANSWHIVSGGAEGVDTMAHRVTVDAGGCTLVILGSGFLHPYPPSNIAFFKEIEQRGGTLISPFSMDTQPDKTTFPARNRVIAGLSQGCLVVRAAGRSGALITAQFALEQGRSVFAVPGSIYDELSVGCHELIKQGAKLVYTATDILEDFNEFVSPSNFTPAITTDIPSMQSAHLVQGESGDIVKQEHFLLSCLASSCTIDELSGKTGLALDDLFDNLFALQLEGKVRQNFAGQWERV